MTLDYITLALLLVFILTRDNDGTFRGLGRFLWGKRRTLDDVLRGDVRIPVISEPYLERHKDSRRFLCLSALAGCECTMATPVPDKPPVGNE